MLIKALCNYYEVLAEKGRILPDGYSVLPIRYLIALNPEGTINSIIDIQKREYLENKGKKKEIVKPVNMLFPKRDNKPGTHSYIAEHRPNYIFGIISNKGILTSDNSKAEKSFKAFKEKNLDFIEGLDSPVINAYRNFINNWKPKAEEENPLLLKIAKELSDSYYAFCLADNTDKLLQDEPDINLKWIEEYNNNNDNKIIAQCAITGKKEKIARLHEPIKGVAGGQSTGKLVCFNNPAEKSYCHEQSYNSNISETAMKKYCEALNYLLASKKNKYIIGETTYVFWATNANEYYDEMFNDLVFNNAALPKEDDAENKLLNVMKNAVQGRLSELPEIDKTVDFYMVGIKPNKTRLAIKSFYHNKLNNILQNVINHQLDISIDSSNKPVSLWQISNELVASKGQKETANANLMGQILESIIHDRPYPDTLLIKIIQRIGADNKINERRAGIIKACINRKSSKNNNKKEKITMALDPDNKNQAYLCGRLFACLERVQYETDNKLNKTIKDSFFRAASLNPDVIFPKLLQLSEHHKRKIANKGNKGKTIWLSKIIGEIIDNLNNTFPHMQSPTEQGKFYIGYYHQRQNFFKKKEETNKENKGE